MFHWMSAFYEIDLHHICGAIPFSFKFKDVRSIPFFFITRTEKRPMSLWNLLALSLTLREFEKHSSEFSLPLDKSMSLYIDTKMIRSWIILDWFRVLSFPCEARRAVPLLRAPGKYSTRTQMALYNYWWLLEPKTYSSCSFHLSMAARKGCILPRQSTESE